MGTVVSREPCAAFVGDMSADEIARIHKRMEPGQCADSGFLAPGDYFPDVIHRDSETLLSLGITHEQIADFMESIMSVFFENSSGSYSPMKIELFGERFVLEYTSWRGSVSCPFSKGRERKVIPKEELLRRLAAKEAELEKAQARKQVAMRHHERAPAEMELRILSGQIDYSLPNDIAKLRAMIEKHDELAFEETLHDCGSNAHYDVVLTNCTTHKSVSFPGLMQHLVREHHFFETGPYRVDPEEFVACTGLKPHISYKLKKQEELTWTFKGSGGYICEYAKNVHPICLPDELVGRASLVTNGIMNPEPTLHIMLYAMPRFEKYTVEGAVLYAQRAYDNCSFTSDTYYIKKPLQRLTGKSTRVDGFVKYVES